MSKYKIKVSTLVLFEAVTGRFICSLLALKKIEIDKKKSLGRIEVMHRVLKKQQKEANVQH